MPPGRRATTPLCDYSSFMPSSEFSIAIVQDELIRRGGGEQVTRCFHQAFPAAPIYAIAYQPQSTFPYFAQCDVRTSWFQRIATNEARLKKFFFPLGILAMRQLDVTGYDVVLLSSTHCAKYVKVSPRALVINYCHTPFRLARNPNSYAEYTQSRGMKRRAFDWLVKTLATIDYQAAQRTDCFIANTSEVSQRIRQAYRFDKPIEIIRPPVDCAKFFVAARVENYFLVVSRLEHYKKLDLVVEAFNRLGYPLVIVGKGSQENALKQAAKPNISFRGGVSEEELANLYAHCRALIFPQHEDYGITPLEANASGRPVIAYGAGGVLDTMIPVKSDPGQATAVLFDQQTVDSLIEAIERFERFDFNPRFIRQHAEKFHETEFIRQIKAYVSRQYESRLTVSAH